MVKCGLLVASGRGTVFQSVVVLLLLAAFSGKNSSARAINTQSRDLFVGWQGESYKPAAKSQVPRPGHLGSTAGPATVLLEDLVAAC